MLKQACPEDSEPLLKQVQHKVQNDTFRVQHDMTRYFMTFAKVSIKEKLFSISLLKISFRSFPREVR